MACYTTHLLQSTWRLMWKIWAIPRGNLRVEAHCYKAAEQGWGPLQLYTFQSDWIGDWVSVSTSSLSRIQCHWASLHGSLCLLYPFPGNWPFVASLAVGVWLWDVRAVLSEDILAPSIRPSCGSRPHGFCACIRFSESSSFSYQYNRGGGSGRQRGWGQGMKVDYWIPQSVQFSHSVVSDSLQPHGVQHTRLPCPSPTPRACSNSRLSSQWFH